MGVEPGGCAFDLLSGNENVEIVSASPASGLRLLRAGDLDAVVLDRWIGEYELARSGISGIQVAREPLEISYSHIAVRKGNEELLDLIDYGLQALERKAPLPAY